jgi:N-acetylglutamate synthase-like GNAT family acetyltransferase
MEIIIREFKKTDIEDVLNVFKKNVPDYFAIEEEKELKDYLTNKVDKYYVIQLDNKIIGSGGINYPSPSVAKISWDIIDPFYHNQGFGTKLLNYRLNILSDNKNLEQIIVRTS